MGHSNKGKALVEWKNAIFVVQAIVAEGEKIHGEYRIELILRPLEDCSNYKNG